MASGGYARLRVHDAFLVKYSAGAQALLPVHSDESMYSLTIALNSADEFAGGGTYFADLDTSLCPPVGHVVAFEGGLFHAGEPIVRGTRYIIAAFLYVEADGEAKADAAAAVSATRDDGGKRQRTTISSMFHDTGGGGGDGDTAGSGGFSFGFALGAPPAQAPAQTQADDESGNAARNEQNQKTRGGFTFGF